MNDQKKWNYEETVERVEEIVDRIESGSLSLEEVFENFAIAVDQLQKCESFLAIGKERMDVLIETLEREEDLEF
jgi:exodeoxyribonuclease VII small subunit